MTWSSSGTCRERTGAGDQRGDSSALGSSVRSIHGGLGGCFCSRATLRVSAGSSPTVLPGLVPELVPLGDAFEGHHRHSPRKAQSGGSSSTSSGHTSGDTSALGISPLGHTELSRATPAPLDECKVGAEPCRSNSQLQLLQFPRCGARGGRVALLPGGSDQALPSRVSRWDREEEKQEATP